VISDYFLGKIFVFFKSKIVDLGIVADVRFSKFILSRVLTNSYYIIFISRFLYIWIPTVVNTPEGSQTCYFWESILQPCISGTNSSCDMKQFDFKIFEFHFGKYPWRILDILLSGKVLCICGAIRIIELLESKFDKYPGRFSDLICFGKVPSNNSFLEHEEQLLWHGTIVFQNFEFQLYLGRL